MLKRIHTVYRLSVDAGVDRAVLDRVLGFHVEHCPVARSIGGSVEITNELALS